MTMVCRDLDLDPKRFPARSLSNQISDLKNELVDYETRARPGGQRHRAEGRGGLPRYQARLREANAIDFDDLIMTTVDLLQVFPDVAEHYRRRFRHVLVDEYQDTNHAQYTLVRELVGALQRARARAPRAAVPTAELCVVGDADQSIYAFRGADIRNILAFEEDFPDAKVVLLEQNYRSTQTILTAANAVIAKNEGRKDKRLWTDAGDGEQVIGYVADNEHDEAAFVAQEVDRLTDEHGVQPHDVAVFYRTNAQSRVFEEVFVRVGLPYRVVGGVRFYERKEVRDALAYLRVLANPADTVILRRDHQHPAPRHRRQGRGVPHALRRARADRVPRGARRAATRSPARDPLGQGVREFADLMDELRTLVERRDAARRGARGGARPHRLPRRAGRERRPAGREPGREPRRARRRRPRVQRAGARRRRRGVPRAGRRWSPTPTRSPTPTAAAASSR